MTTKESPQFRDEDFDWKWGNLGKTAKIASVKWCSDNGFYDTKIVDDGNWKFKAVCSGKVPDDRSRRFTRESAESLGFASIEDAARADCAKKGYTDIAPESSDASGFYDYSHKCLDVKWDQSYTGCDGNGNILTLQKCNNWVKNNVDSCKSSPSRPKDTKRWIKCAIGSSPNGFVPGDSSQICYPLSKDDKDFTCQWGHNCFAVTDIKRDLEKCPISFFNNLDPTTREDVDWDKEYSGNDTNGSKIKIKKCYNWPNNDPEKCKTSPTKPKDIKAWIACGTGSSPGGIAKGDSATACSPISNGPDDFTCIWGQNCYAVTDVDVNWEPPQTGCDGNGKILTIQKCINWVKNKPETCFNSVTKPPAKKWIACALGSSPGGIYPGSGARACSPLSEGPDNFTCAGGQDCFVVTNEIDDLKKCPKSVLTNPFGAIGDFFSVNKFYIIGAIVLIILILIFAAYIKIKFF